MEQAVKLEQLVTGPALFKPVGRLRLAQPDARPYVLLRGDLVPSHCRPDYPVHRPAVAVRGVCVKSCSGHLHSLLLFGWVVGIWFGAFWVVSDLH